jgi:hypothetical protein
VLDKHRGGQDEIGHLGSLCHELLVHDGKKIFSFKALAGETMVGGNDHRVGVLDQQRLDRCTCFQSIDVSGEDGADAAHIEFAHIRLAQRRAGDFRLVQRPSA